MPHILSQARLISRIRRLAQRAAFRQNPLLIIAKNEEKHKVKAEGKIIGISKKIGYSNVIKKCNFACKA